MSCSVGGGRAHFSIEGLAQDHSGNSLVLETLAQIAGLHRQEIAVKTGEHAPVEVVPNWGAVDSGKEC